ncbi:hypothetical protein Tco_1382822 [Tanacetum coccineum]
MPYDSPLSRGNTPRSKEGSNTLNELTKLCTKLFDKVTNLEDDLKQTKKIYGKALTKLVKKVKQLEAKLKSTTERRKVRMVIYEDEKDLVSKDTSKYGRMTKTEYEKVEIDLNKTDDDLQRRSIIEEIDLAKILADASRERVKTYTRRRRSIDSSRDSTAGGLFSTAEGVQGKEQISTDEKVSQKLNNEEMARAAAREEQERTNFEKALELQKTDTEVEKTKTKRNAEETLLQESFKKLRAAEASRSEPIQEQPTEEPKELSEEELKKMLEIVPVEEIKAEALQAYQVFEDMLKGFDREDLVTLWSLVKERFRSVEPTKYKERALWVELKRLFKLDNDDVLWKLQRYMYDPLT